MKCPYCGYKESKVIDSRPAEEGSSIRRRRECLSCAKRFTTYETVESLPMVVIKKDGSRQSFDKRKVLNGMIRACEKRPVPFEVLEQKAGEIEEPLQNSHEREVSSEDIGGQALAQLHAALEGHALDDADLHLAAGDLGSQQQVQDAESLGHDEGADAIAGHDADGDGVELGEVGDFFVSLHAVDAGEVGADELSELFLCGLDLFFLQSSRDVFRHKCSPFQK